MSKGINYLPLGILTGITLTSGAVLASAGSSAVATCTSVNNQLQCSESTSATASVTVTTNCGFSDTPADRTATLSPANGGSAESDTISTTVFCNDTSGFTVYAVGYTGDTTTPAVAGDNTKLVGATTGLKIATGTSGSDSYWAFRLAATSGTYQPTIASGYDSWHTIPASATPVVTFGGTTDTTTGSQFTTQYKVYASSSQSADTYTGKVRYTLTQ